MCKDETALIFFSFSSLKKTKSFRSWVIFTIVLLLTGIHSIVPFQIRNPIVLTVDRNLLLFKSHLCWNLATDRNLDGDRNRVSADTSPTPPSIELHCHV